VATARVLIMKAPAQEDQREYCTNLGLKDSSFKAVSCMERLRKVEAEEISEDLQQCELRCQKQK
jgi:hypothetical protein